MKKTIMVFGVLVLVLAITGGAFAAKGLLTGADIKNGSLTGADIKSHSLGVGLFSTATLNKITGKQGAALGGPPGPTGASGPAGVTGATGASGVAGAQGLQGVPGSSAAGLKGDTGAQGAKGDTGTTGAAGAASTVAGPAGQAGQNGAPGVKGDPGAPWVPSYGIADVKVSRGGAAASIWATYSTTLGSPVGDTASGTFRFTCSTAKAPCTVGLDAYTSGSKTASLYPRMLVYRTSTITEGSPVECEYGDGTNNGGGTQSLTSTATTTPLGIGGTFDCNGGQTALPDPTNGGLMPVDSITVPEGYYDVFTALAFKSS